MTTRLILCRHGETPWSVEYRFAGSSDIPITDNGVQMATNLGFRLESVDVDHVYCSPRLRCQMTAAPYLEATGAHAHPDDRIVECDFGAWEGHTAAEAKSADPDFWAEWVKDTSVSAPGGESWDDVLARTTDWLEDVSERHAGQTVLAFTHGGVVLSLLRGVLLGDGHILRSLVIDPCSVTVFTKDRFWRVPTVNGVAHLRDPLTGRPLPWTRI